MKEDVKQLTNGYTNSMQEMWEDYVAYLSSIKDMCENTPIKITKKRGAGGSLELEIPDAKYKLCDAYEETKVWAEHILKISELILNVPIETVSILCRALGETAEYAMSIIEQGVAYATNWLTEKLDNITSNSKWVKKIINVLKRTLLNIKVAALWAEEVALKNTKKVLTFFANGKATKNDKLEKSTKPISNFINATIKVIDVILKFVDGLLSSIIGFTLDGGIMGFFPTPKSMISGFFPVEMKPKNANQDIYSNIADVLISPIEEGFRQASILAVQMKSKAMEAEIEANKQLLTSTNEIIDIPDSQISLEESYDLSKVKAAIALLLSTLITPEPLPKYERLHPGNLGYMAWLLTSFEPSMKKCFGIPSFP